MLILLFALADSAHWPISALEAYILTAELILEAAGLWIYIAYELMSAGRHPR
jgi:hypothetical protein